MKFAKLLIGVCAGTLLLSGCMTEEPITQRASEERIELIENRSFSIELLDAKTLINDDGLLTVDASVLLSRTGSFRWVFAGDPNVTIWYHFDWIDAQGNILKPIQREMVALPGNIVNLHGVAPEEKYINYHLTISLKGPETDEEAAQQRDQLKKRYVKSGKVKKAGKSKAKKTSSKKSASKKQPVKQETAASEVKPEAKSEPVKQEVKSEPAKTEAKAEPVKQEVKSEPAKAKSEAKTQPQKLTEPFD